MSERYRPHKALSSSSDTQALDIFEAQTDARPFVDRAAFKARSTKLFFHNYPAVAVQVEHDFDNFSMAWPKFNNAVAGKFSVSSMTADPRAHASRLGQRKVAAAKCKGRRHQN